MLRNYRNYSDIDLAVTALKDAADAAFGIYSAGDGSVAAAILRQIPLICARIETLIIDEKKSPETGLAVGLGAVERESANDGEPSIS